jgi:DNA-binding response OmpR family regulator
MKPRIILIEDNLGDVGIIRRALDRHVKSYHLEVIHNGSDALRLFQSVESEAQAMPDLVVLDLNLPRVPGKRLLRYLRESSRLCAIPVIVATSSDAVADRSDAIQYHATFFTKPSDVGSFMKIGELVAEKVFKPSR